MMPKIYYIIFFFLMCPLSSLFSQGETDLQPRMLFRNENSFGIHLNSNGTGAGYRFGQRLTARSQNIYEADFLSIKHPKEIRISNNIYNNRSFIFGKENLFFELKGMIGKQNELYRKNDVGGISIRYFYTGGPALGILKPVYYDVLYTTGVPFDFYIETEKFNPSIHQSNIYGRASFFKGLKEISIVPGVSVKGGISFEYSQLDVTLHSIETGVSLEVFPKKIPIMATSRNNFLFFNLFVSYRFGKYTDISEGAQAARAREREERRISRRVIKDQRKKEKEEVFY